MPELKIESLKDIQTVANEFISNINNNKIIAFYGEMGVGKTTFIKQICKELGVATEITSPTFSLVNEYETDKNEIIYHFDFYRLDTPEEALDFGLFEYLDSGNYCFMEWPEIIEDLLPDNILRVKIILNNDTTRTIKF